MADFSSYTHKWRATTNNSHYNSNDKVTKRNRQPVSCQSCRAKKLKCDRGHPCDGCRKRNEADSCSYGKLSNTVPAATPSRRDELRTSHMKAQDRLKHLEDLVRNMAESPRGPIPTPPQDDPTTPNTLTSPSIDATITRSAVDGGSYTGSTHWSAILEHINELKNDIIPGSNDDDSEEIDYSKPDALFGDHRQPSLDHILKARLPPRVQVDRRVSQYFNAKYAIIPFIHAPQFQRQYEKFWNDPSNANPVWTSILFSICSLAAGLNSFSNQAPFAKWALPAQATPRDGAQTINSQESFLIAAGQCLVLANYSKPQPFVVEAISLYLQCKYAMSLDPQKEVAILFAVHARLAYLMGYHRDGTNFPHQFSPFETEMRRRTFAMVKQFDLLIAFQLGIPNNVAPESWDTQRPRNLLDSDFDEDTKVLPPSRPETDLTQILYFTVKSRIIDIYAKICHRAISFPAVEATASEIMALDAELRLQADTIPEALRVRPIAQSIADQAHEVMVRVNVSFLWRKALCVLHRKYLTSTGNDYSYNTCVEAASAICATIIDMYPEFQPGGAFEANRWMLSSFTIIDFLMGAIVLCLTISISRKRYVNKGGNPQSWLTLPETSKVLEILDRSKVICQEVGQRSKEAKRVSAVLKAVLGKLRTSQQGPAAGGDGERYFLNMSNGTLREDRPDRPSNEGAIVDEGGVSMKPLWISESQKLKTVFPGILPSSFPGPGGCYDSPRLGDIGLSPMKTTPSLDTGTFNGAGSNIKTPANVNTNGSRYGLTAAAPPTFMMDSEYGPFGNIMSTFDDADFGNIDWTQFDQFTGVWGSDNSFSMFDPAFPAPPTISQRQSIETPHIDYEDWTSTPIFSLGARSRDPLTGVSQEP